MRRGLFTFALILGGLYLLVHLILGSSPVQRRVLAEIRGALAKYGLDLKIESIEFSAFSPKIYLNRVTITAGPKAIVSFPEPVAIDKIKIEFEPLALISRRIVIEDATLFHPRIILPQADRLYRKVSRLLGEKKAPQVQSGGFSLVVKKFGVVDALFNIQSKDPAISIRSRALSAFLTNSIIGQQTITVESTDLEIERGGLKLALTRTDVDVDITKKSLRVNRAVVEGNHLAIDLKATMSLPFREGKGPDALSASFDVHLPLPLLGKIQELKVPKMSGAISTSGTLSLANGNPTGSGRLSYEGIAVQDYKFGSGSLLYNLSDKKVALSEIDLHYAGGDLRSSSVRVALFDRFAIDGELAIKDVKLEGILDSVKAGDTPIRMGITGSVKASGFLAGPFELNGEVKTNVSNFTVVKNHKKETSVANTILTAKEGAVDGVLKFTEDKMGFQAGVNILGGKANIDGFLGFKQTAKIHVASEGLSLTELHRISGLHLGGTTNLTCDIEVHGDDAKVSGNFDITGAEVADVALGSVRGEGYFRDAMLSFENLELPSLEPIRGSGFVDFRPKLTHYRFNAEARRAELNQVFAAMHKMKLGFGIPSGGEVSARLAIEGHDEDVEITTSGTAKNFTWKGERWMSSGFNLTYRPEAIDLTRLMLLKKSGGLELRGRFTDKESTLNIQSHGLRVEEFDSLGKAPLVGELVGEGKLEGDLSNGPVRGSGEIRLNKVLFRGAPVPDSVFRLQTANNQVEFLGNVVGQKLRARYLMSLKPKDPSELLVYFQDFDFTPIAALFLGKDIPTLSDVTATGDFSLKGSFADWMSLKGSGSVTSLFLGFRGTPMKNKQPLEIKVDNGTVKVPRFNLAGTDSQVSLDFSYEPNVSVRASLDGKLDLQFLQPFIPGLDYGTGLVTAGLRLSGRPPGYELIGNVLLEDGAFRLEGLDDEFRSVQAQLSVSQDRVNFDRFTANVGGGVMSVDGDVRINRFHSLIPNLSINANRVTMKLQNFLATTFSGDFTLKGNAQPYTLGGHCRMAQAELTKLDTGPPKRPSEGPPILLFNLNCEAKDHLFANTDVVKAEFRGNLNVVGSSAKPALLGSLEAITENKNGRQGTIYFRETKFNLDSGNVRFESSDRIAPRFNMMGSTVVQEQKQINPQQYQIYLQVSGVPEDYRIRLSSTPSLLESDIISLLVLGVTSKNAAEGGGIDFGAAIAGQIPLQEMLQKQLGVGVSLGTSQAKSTTQTTTGTSASATDTGYTSVPTVKIQKEIDNKTKLSYSNTLETVQSRELKIERILDEHFSVNGSATVGPNRSTAIQLQTDPSNPSYGIDFRYRFEFE